MSSAGGRGKVHSAVVWGGVWNLWFLSFWRFPVQPEVVSGRPGSEFWNLLLGETGWVLCGADFSAGLGTWPKPFWSFHWGLGG